MKIRQGFVSNSSSSSFLIFGKDVEILKITPKIIKENNIMVIGENLNDGVDVFQIKTIEELAFLKALNKLCMDNSFRYVNSFASSDLEGENEGEIDIKKIPKIGKIKYYNLYQDYNSSFNLTTLRGRYDEFGKTDFVMRRYLRGEKLIKINNNNT